MPLQPAPGRAAPDDQPDAAEENRYSYRVVFSPPLGRSYAERIAARYGIGLEQLLALLHRRRVLDE